MSKRVSPPSPFVVLLVVSTLFAWTLPLVAQTGTSDGDDLPSIGVGLANLTKDDPNQDGWDTEAFSRAAEKQLKELARILSHPEKLEVAQVEGLLREEFACDSLVPKKARTVFRDHAIEVFRAQARRTGGNKPYRGVNGLVKALQALLQPYREASDIHAAFKIFQVHLGKGFVTTRQYFTLSGRTKAGSREQNATWSIRWVRPAESGAPRMERIEIEDYEHVVARSPSQTLFADCTEAVLGHNACFQPQLMRGLNHWMPRIQMVLGLEAAGHQGVAVGDVNGDGLEDVYLCQIGGLPNRLFIQNEDGTATDVAQAAGVDFLDLTRSALFIDIDQDGDQDLVLTPKSGVLFMANDGLGHFARQALIPVDRYMTSLAAADYDHDGDLDLYVCVYAGSSKEVGVLGTPVPYHDANNGGANILLRNDGDWQFTDVTDQVGFNHNNTRWSFAASWEDFDNDGDQDLYVANDYGRNNLYRNDDGHFVDVAGQAGVEDISAGMAVTWSDYNRNGLMDLYVSNMFSSAGSRVTYQRRFQSDSSQETKAQFQRHARGNSLFENAGDGTFRDISVETGVTMGRWAWGSLFFDLNNDGWDDLLVANGFVTNQKVEDL